MIGANERVPLSKFCEQVFLVSTIHAFRAIDDEETHLQEVGDERTIRGGGSGLGIGSSRRSMEDKTRLEGRRHGIVRERRAEIQSQREANTCKGRCRG